MNRPGKFDPLADSCKPSVLTEAERTRINNLWNSTTRLSKEDYAWMKEAERRMLH